MAKTNDMLVKNYAKLKGAEEGEEINWAAICVENFWKCANLVTTTNGRVTILHAHLNLLAKAAH